jgi:hypothetical protein
LQKKAIRGPRPLDELIRSFLREGGLGTQGHSERIFRAWNEVVGQKMKASAKPVRFRSGELSVEVSSSALLYELRSFTGEGYRSAANDKLGQDTIRKITFRLRT